MSVPTSTQQPAGIARAGSTLAPRVVEVAVRSPGAASAQIRAPVVVAIEASADGGAGASYRALPSGLFALTFHVDRLLQLRGAASNAANPSNASRASAVAPVRSVYRDMAMAGAGRVVVVFLTPLDMTGLLDEPDWLARADELPAAALLGEATVRRIHERLAASHSLDDAAQVVHAELQARLLVRRARPMAALRAARTAMHMLSQPADSLDSVAAREGVSRRQWARDFHRTLGLSPKAYSRVARAQAAAAGIAAGWPLCEAALSVGYSDQSHMCNELRRVAGLPASAIRARAARPAGAALRAALPNCLVAI